MAARRLGGGTAKRHRRKSKTNIEGLTPAALKRLARRAGVKRVSRDAMIEVRNELQVWMESIIKDALVYTEYGNRKTVSETDIAQALKRMDATVYSSSQPGGVY